jgi:hypothetical protein
MLCILAVFLTKGKAPGEAQLFLATEATADDIPPSHFWSGSDAFHRRIILRSTCQTIPKRLPPTTFSRGTEWRCRV